MPLLCTAKKKCVKQTSRGSLLRPPVLSSLSCSPQTSETSTILQSPLCSSSAGKHHTRLAIAFTCITLHPQSVLILLYFLYMADTSQQVTGWDFLTVLHMDGCQGACAFEKHCLLPTDILIYHEHFDALPKSARRQWILDYLNTHSSVNTTTSEATTVFLICGKSVCQSLWLATLGISTSVFYEVRRLFLDGSKKLNQEVHRTPQIRTSEAIAWMDCFFTLVGDQLPHSMAIYLPSSLTKSGVYQRLAADMRQRDKPAIVSQPQFFRLWDEHFQHVSIPKVCLVCGA